MIDAWDIYWVMQLDSIGRSLRFIVFALFILSGAFSIRAVWCSVQSPDDWLSEECKTAAAASRASEPAARSAAIRFGVAFLAVMSVNALIPSSKTAAAMIVLPALTSESVVQTVAPEARELYELAKDALRNVSKDKGAKEGEAK
jgi:hypothetical protein